MKTPLLKEMFKEFKVLTLDHVSQTHECSIRTVQRQFAQLSVLRSYNKNSRYYTLPDTPKFNIHGIWEYRSIFFSKFGDLRGTVKQLILNSEYGLNGSEIGEIVDLLPRSFMHHFRGMEGVFREKYAGVYVYFSNDPTVYIRQSDKRSQICDVQKIKDDVAVKLLIAYIKHPELSAEELLASLASKISSDVSTAMVTSFLLFHDLLKKTPDS